MSERTQEAIILAGRREGGAVEPGVGLLNTVSAVLMSAWARSWTPVRAPVQLPGSVCAALGVAKPIP